VLNVLQLENILLVCVEDTPKDLSGVSIMRHFVVRTKMVLASSNFFYVTSSSSTRRFATRRTTGTDTALPASL
jgi:hypothetical protein